MKKKLTAVALFAALLLVVTFWTVPQAQESGNQQLLNLSWLSTGPTAQGSRGLQVGEVSKISAAVSTAAVRTEAVAAPAAGLSIYLRGILVEKATATTGSVTVTQGTGTNCATSPVVLFTIGAGSPPIGVYPVSTQVPAAKALCLTTDATTTSARALYLD